MVWHIFKKDARLLWPFALTVAMLQAINGALHFIRGYFTKSADLIVISNFFPIVVLVGIVFLTVVLVQQDPLPGTREDWLVRPVKRRDLLLAKLLFVLLMIHLPILALDMLEETAVGFVGSDAISAAIWREWTLFVTFTVPAFLLGVTTRSLVEAMLLGGIGLAGCALLFVMASVLGLTRVTTQTGVGWIAVIGANLVLLLGTAATLVFQYARRQTLLARAMATSAVLAALAFLYVPFEPTFAIQRWIAASRSDQAPISVSFRPEESTTASAPAVPMKSDAQTITRGSAQLLDKATATVRLPIHIAGLPRASILLADQVTVRLIDDAGRALYEGLGVCTRNANGVGSSCLPNELEVHAQDTDNSSADVAQVLRVPAEVYNKLKAQPLRVELDYALTSFAVRPQVTIGADAGPRKLAGMGSCATRVDDDLDTVDLHCMTPSSLPSCVTAVLRDPQTGVHNPEMHRCEASYIPFVENVYSDVLGHFGIGMQVTDSSHVVHFPIDVARIPQALLTITTYEPGEHFTRKLVVPGIRLSDWQFHEEKVADPVAVGYYRHMN